MLTKSHDVAKCRNAGPESKQDSRFISQAPVLAWQMLKTAQGLFEVNKGDWVVNDWDDWYKQMAYIHRARVLRAQVTLRLLRLGIASLEKLARVGLAATAALGRSVLRAAARAHQRRVTIRALMAINDRTLRDIGLHRSQIPSVVEEMFRDTPPYASRSTAKAVTTGTRGLSSRKQSSDDRELERAA